MNSELQKIKTLFDGGLKEHRNQLLKPQTIDELRTLAYAAVITPLEQRANEAEERFNAALQKRGAEEKKIIQLEPRVLELEGKKNGLEVAVTELEQKVANLTQELQRKEEAVAVYDALHRGVPRVAGGAA